MSNPTMENATDQTTGKRGRPSKYTPAVAEEIIRRLSEGESLRRICRDKGMPNHSTVVTWVREDREGFRCRYDQARELLLDMMFDEILDIADGDGEWGRDRLRVDSRKWYLSKLAPKRFGDRLHVDQKTELQHVTDEELDEALMQKMKRLVVECPEFGKRMLEMLQELTADQSGEGRKALGYSLPHEYITPVGDFQHPRAGKERTQTARIAREYAY